MAFLLALASSVLYGSADFLGGWAARRAPVLVVTAAAQAAGLVVLLVAAAFVPGVLAPAGVAWGAAAGLSGSAGVVLLYRALAIGTVSTVAPLISMIAIFVPVVVGVAGGDRLGWAGGGGIALGVLAVAMIGAGERGGARVFPDRGALLTALASGVCIGGFLVAIGHIPSGGGLWPLVLARGTGTAALAALLAVRGAAAAPARALWPAIAGCGALDVAANLLFWYASRHGALSLVATIVSLAPASTVVLAQWVLRERLGVLQKAGVAVAMVAIVLLAQGPGH